LISQGKKDFSVVMHTTSGGFYKERPLSITYPQDCKENYWRVV